MKTIEDLKVGDTVWYLDVNGRGQPPRPLEVEKIGRVLITAGRTVFRKDTMRTNDGYGNQSLIVDLAAYEREKRTSRVLWLISDGLRYKKVTASLEDLIVAAKLLGIDIGDEL